MSSLRLQSSTHHSIHSSIGALTGVSNPPTSQFTDTASNQVRAFSDITEESRQSISEILCTTNTGLSTALPTSGSPDLISSSGDEAPIQSILPKQPNKNAEFSAAGGGGGGR